MRAFNKLTARRVATENAPGLYGDGGGLWLQVSAGASKQHVTKSWLFRFMLDGRSRGMGLGPIHTVSLADAREKAREARQKLLSGIDPIEARLGEREARRAQDAANILFKDAAEKYIAVHESQWSNAKHRAQWKSTLKAYAFPSIGLRPISVIDAALISETLASIWQKKPETASRVKQRIERIVQWVRDGLPLPAPSKARRVKHHEALPWQEIPTFMSELRERESVSARALEFLILTASRTGAIIGARWPEIDLDKKVWAVPASRAGTKIRKDHRVPLTDRAIELIEALPRDRRDDHVFIGAIEGTGLSNMAMLELLKGMKPGLTVHGFRSSFKDWASEATNHPNIVSEAALAHSVPDKVEAAYRRGELFEKRRKLMRDWATYCERRPTTAKVISLRMPEVVGNGIVRQ